MKIRCVTRGAYCNIHPSHISQVKQYECHIPTIEAEEIARGHLLQEPRKDAATLYFDENSERGLAMDDISSTFRYGIKSYRGGLDSDTAAADGNHLKRGGFKGILHEDGVPNLQPHMRLTNACGDYMLDKDDDLTKKVPELEYHFCEEAGMEVSSESHSPGPINGAVRPFKSRIDCKPGPFEMIIPHEPHCGFDSTSGSISPVSEGMHPRCSTSLKNFDETKPVARTLGGSGSHHWRENKSNIVHFRNPERMQWVHTDVEHNSDGGSESEAEGEHTQDVFIDCSDRALDRPKRSRQPPQRYINESSHYMSQKQSGRKEGSVRSKKGKHLGVSSQYKQRKKRSMIALWHSSQGSPGIAPRPVPFEEHQEFSVRHLPKMEYPVNRRTRKEAELNFSPVEGFDSDDDDEYVPDPSTSAKRILRKGSNRRKCQKSWSISEVGNLLDGISRFGVGKWTAIRKTFFSSSYRTPLDIRDKWRNLLRASYSKLKDNAEDEGLRTTNGLQPLPKSLLERVSELASRYPYPRKGSKLSRTSKHDFSLPWPE